eukprot:EG_transcript_1294
MDGWFVSEVAKAYTLLRATDDVCMFWGRIARMDLESMPLNVQGCNSFIKAFKEFHDPERIRQVLYTMEQKSIEPNYQTYSILMDFYVHVGKTRAAEEVFLTKLRHNVATPPKEHATVAYNIYFVVLAKERRWAEMQQFVDELRAAVGITDHSLVLKLYGKGGRCAEMEATLRVMKEAGEPMCSCVHRALIMGYGATGQYAKVQHVMDAVVAALATVQCVMDAVVAAGLAGATGQYATVQRVMDDVVAVGLPVLSGVATEHPHPAPEKDWRLLWQTYVWNYAPHDPNAARSMRQAGFEWDASVYSELISMKGERFAMMEAHTLWAQMDHDRVLRTVQAHDAYLHAHCKYGETGPLRQLLAGAIGRHGKAQKLSDTELEVLAVLGAGNELEALLDGQPPPEQRLGLVLRLGLLGGAGYCHAIRHFRKARLLQRVRRVREQMRDSGVAETAEVAVALVRALAACQGWDELQALYEEYSTAPMPADLLTAFLRAYFAFHRVDVVQRVLVQMQNDRMEKSLGDCCALLEGYAECGLEAEAYALVPDFERHPGAFQTPDTLAAFITAGSAFSRTADVDRYWKLCRDLPGLRLRPTKAVLRAWARGGDGAALRDFADAARLNDLPPPIMKVLVYELGKLHHFEHIERLMGRFRAERRPLSLQTYTALVLVYGVDRNFAMVESLVAEVTAAQKPVSNARVAGDNPKGLPPQLANALVYVYGRARRWADVLQLLDDLVATAGVQAATLLWLARACHAARGDPAAIDPIALNELYRVLSLRQKVEVLAYATGEPGEDLLAEGGAVETGDTVRWLFGLYCQTELMEAAEKVWSAHRLEPSARQVQHLVRGYCRAGQVERAKDLLGRFPSAFGVYAVSHIVSAYCRRRDRMRAEDEAFTLRHHGLRPTLLIYNSLLCMYLLLGTDGALTATLQEMRGEGVAPNFATFAILALLDQHFSGAALAQLSAAAALFVLGTHPVQEEKLDLETILGCLEGDGDDIPSL